MADQRVLANESTIVAEREPKVETRDTRPARDKDHEIKEVRAGDIEPYTGLGYLSKLFRFMAIIMVLLLVAEIATGIYTQGSASVPTLLGEASRLIVLAGVLWGTGDLALLLIDIGHDVRATRILAARVAHAAKVPPLIPVRLAENPRGESAFSDRPAPRRDRSGSLGDPDDAPPIP